MIYNKTKRTLEIVAASLELALGILLVGLALFLFIYPVVLYERIMNLSYSATAEMVSVVIFRQYLFGGIITFAISICSIVFGALLLKNPVRQEGVLNTKGKQIAFVVISFLSGNLVSFGLEIAVLSLPDFVPNNSETTLLTQQTQQNSIEYRINELKHLKELGVIDETTYNTAVAKIIEEIKEGS